MVEFITTLKVTLSLTSLRRAEKARRATVMVMVMATVMVTAMVMVTEAVTITAKNQKQRNNYI